jgi:hypothetical protein
MKVVGASEADSTKIAPNFGEITTTSMQMKTNFYFVLLGIGISFGHNYTITNKRQNDCLHTDLLFVQTSFHSHGHHQVLIKYSIFFKSVPDDAREGENKSVQIVNQCVDNHFAFYFL